MPTAAAAWGVYPPILLYQGGWGTWHTEDETAPQTVKIFQGQASIGFQEAEEEQSVQTLELTKSQIDDGYRGVMP